MRVVIRRSLVTLRLVLAGSLFAGGCANILGFDDASTLVSCVTSQDCPHDNVCVRSLCVCEHDCAAQGGTAGFVPPPGGEGGDSAVLGGAGAALEGGSGGQAGGSHPPDVGGRAGSSQGQGGVPSAGHAGAGGQSGDHQGGAGEGGSAASGAGAPTECDPELKSCLVCDESGEYVPGSPCPALCDENADCATPHSCNGQTVQCANLNCCLSLPTPGGKFTRACDHTCQRTCNPPEHGFPAKISKFTLDAFEVTVDRFRPFVFAYPASKPDVGDGANASNSTVDKGWENDWTGNLPPEQADLLAQLSSDNCGEYATWSVTENDDLPINCVSWYVAQAFCISDGGRLPTEAEWDYIASGGEEQRTYPWSTSPDDLTVDQDHATYYLSGGNFGVTPVGSHSSGTGKWGHYDLAGNVGEWVWDGFTDCYPTTDCNNCGQTDGNPAKGQRGGSFLDDPNWIRVETRSSDVGTIASPTVGFRCAHDL